MRSRPLCMCRAGRQLRPHVIEHFDEYAVGVGNLQQSKVRKLRAVIVVWRLRRRTAAGSRFDEKLTVVIVLVLGISIEPTSAGQGVLHMIA